MKKSFDRQRARAALFSFALGWSLASCQAIEQFTSSKSTDTEGKPTPAEAVAASNSTEPQSTTADTKSGKELEGTLSPPSAMVQLRKKAPPAKLYSQPVERRLYSDRIESSSFLWTTWNRFQENYHPNYIMDGDPKTAWTEGADHSGAGEWVRIHLSPVEGATQIRLRMQNGYHKSESLYKKNARLKNVQITALPSGQTHTVTLPDSMDWQEITFTQPEGLLNGLEIKAIDVYEGSKYTDLCISEVEVYVTGLTVENPDFEKKKLEDLLAWKKERVAAAEEWKNRKDEPLPIASNYRVIQGALKGEIERTDDGYFSHALNLAAKTVPSAREEIERAKKALKTKNEEYIALQLVIAKEIDLPWIDGLYLASEEDLFHGGADDGFMLPSYKEGALLLSTNLKTLDIQGKRRGDQDCEPGTTKFWRTPSSRAEGPFPQEIIMDICVESEERDGFYTFMATQVLEFDKEGRLVLVVGPHNVLWFEWRDSPNGPVLSGGLRFRLYSDTIDKLVEVREGDVPAAAGE